MKEIVLKNNEEMRRLTVSNYRDVLVEARKIGEFDTYFSEVRSSTSIEEVADIYKNHGFITIYTA